VVMLQFLEAFMQADWSCMHWLFRSLGVLLAKRELFSPPVPAWVSALGL